MPEPGTDSFKCCLRKNAAAWMVVIFATECDKLSATCDSAAPKLENHSRALGGICQLLSSFQMNAKGRSSSVGLLRYEQPESFGNTHSASTDRWKCWCVSFFWTKRQFNSLRMFGLLNFKCCNCSASLRSLPKWLDGMPATNSFVWQNNRSILQSV